MKYNLKKIMSRAWEIKELVDQKTKNSLLNRNIFRELKKEEKALFSECLKEAWKEAKRASELEKELKIKKRAVGKACKKRNTAFFAIMRRCFSCLEYLARNESFESILQSCWLEQLC